MRIFFSVGEPSGDLHGANLIRTLQQLDPKVECVGYGGPLMAEAGCRLHADLTALAVMWIARVLANLHKFLDLASRADRYFRHQRPDAVVLIDYPGFNWWIARRAKAHGIPVFYYVPPQIWGWASHRVRKMRRFVDHVLCSLPFEPKWYAQRGCRATYVGHPFFDEVRRQRLDADFLASMQQAPGPLVSILPGSRTQEVEANLPGFLQAAAAIRRQVPEARFAVAAFKESQKEIAERMIAEANREAEANLPVTVHLHRTPELIRAADACLACSGSVSLELLHALKPTVIGYRVSRFGYAVQNVLRNAPYITLVNLLSTGRLMRDRRAERTTDVNADPRVLYPEFLADRDRSADMAAIVGRWLNDPTARAATVAKLTALREQVGMPGASLRAAEYIHRVLAERTTSVPKPHYLADADSALTMSAEAIRRAE